MDDVANQVIGGAWETMGVGAGMFLIVMLILGGGGFGVYRLASQWMALQATKKKSTPPKPAERSSDPGAMLGIATKEAKSAVADAKTQAERTLGLLEKQNEEYQTRTSERITRIEDKDEAQEEELKALHAKVIKLEEWRNHLEQAKRQSLAAEYHQAIKP